MDAKKIRKSISHFFAWLGLSGVSLIVNVLPAPLLYGFASGIARIGYVCAVKQRKIALASLQIAFGSQKSEAEREQIARQCFAYMAKSSIELMYLIDKPAVMKKQVRLVHKERLDQALAAGKGVVLVSAHFGNFPLLLGRLCLEGYRAGGIMRPMHDARVEKIFVKKRKRYGVRTIYSQPRKECVDETIRALRQNEIIFIPIDQNFGTGGVFVEFFGIKAATATGPAIFAQRTGAALLPCFILRQPDDTHEIVFEEPFWVPEGVRGEEAVFTVIQDLTYIIESYIKKYPAEWGWIHKRWKSKPSLKGGG